MERNKMFLWIKVAFMLASLAGVFSMMGYFNSGKAFKDPGSPVQVLLGNSAQPTARPAKILIEKGPSERKPSSAEASTH